jgi:hypothetical protein
LGVRFRQILGWKKGIFSHPERSARHVALSDMGQPCVFVPLEMDVCQKKVRYIMEALQSQRHKRWFQLECNAASGYAEAFYCHKLVI